MPMDIYDGRSPIEMEYLVNDPFCENSPLVLLRDFDKEALEHVPFFCLVKKLLTVIDEAGSLKLTAQGNLPTKLVKDLNNINFIHEPWLDEKEDKIIKEFDSLTISSARIIAELAGFTKKIKNQLTLSKKCKQMLDKEDDIAMFYEIFKAFTLKFDWSYNDYFGDNEVGQLGFAFTLDLVEKYGTTENTYAFYAEKYRQALIEAFIEQEAMGKKVINNFFDEAFMHRSFDLFMHWFGLIFVTDDNSPSFKNYKIQKSPIFNTLFRFD